MASINRNDGNHNGFADERSIIDDSANINQLHVNLQPYF